MDPFSELHAVGLVALAGALGGALGLERELAGKPAGLRTHILVASASALLVLLSKRAVLQIGDGLPVEAIQADPIRIIQAVVLGISFLGAGTIFVRRDRDRVEGLTTAASILMSAGLGMAVGLHEVVLAVSIALLVLMVLVVVGYLEKGLLARARRARPGAAETSPRSSPAASAMTGSSPGSAPGRELPST